MDEGVVRRGPLQSGLCQREWLSYQLRGRELFGHQCLSGDLPPGLPDEALQRVLDLIVARHEVLRSTFVRTSSGDPEQVVWPPASIPIRRWSADSGMSPEMFVMAMDKKPFRIAEEWPIRAARLDDRLYLALAHIAIDGWGTSVLIRELTEAIAAAAEGREPALPPVSGHALDQALWEHTPEGRRANAKALAFWHADLTRRPSGLFPVPVIPPPPGYLSFVLRSRAAGLALDRLATVGTCPRNAVFTAAAAMAFGHAFAQDAVPFTLTWAARERAASRSIVASTFRDIVLDIDLAAAEPAGTAPGLAAVARQAMQKILRAGMRSQFDVVEFMEVETRVSVERGERLRAGLVVNFRPFDQRTRPPAGPIEYRSMLEASELSLVRRPGWPREETDLWMEASPGEDGLTLLMIVNEALVDEATGVRLLRGIERMVVEFDEHGDVAAADLPSLLSIPRPVRGPEWTCVNRSWVHLPTTEDLLLTHPDVEAVRVDAGGPGLACVVDTRNPRLRPSDLRRYLLGRLDLKQAVACPQFFEIRTPDGAVLATGAGTGPCSVAPTGDRERALYRAVAVANGLSGLSMADNYVTAGGSLVRVPRVLELLAEAGFSGLCLDDFRVPGDLAQLAARLTVNPRGEGPP